MTGVRDPAERDTLQRFVFEHGHVRGELVRLDATWLEVLARRDYPEALLGPLGELMAACALLAATIKLDDGELVLQIQGGRPVSLLVVECLGGLTLRATAQWHGDLGALGPSPSLRTLAAGGRCAITLDPGAGQAAYQGIVPLEGQTTAEVLERYMARSEQLDTRFALAADGRRAAGLLLQRLPNHGGHGRAQDAELWERAAPLAHGFSPVELLQLSQAELLRRVFRADDLRLFETRIVRFGCRCSRERVAGLIRMLGAEEAHGILSEQGRIEVTCEFCAQRFEFDPGQTEQALTGVDQPTPA
jgi:molecular chaperone Hsp33